MNIEHLMTTAPVGSVWWLGEGAWFVVVDHAARWDTPTQGFGRMWDVLLRAETSSGLMVVTIGAPALLSEWMRVDLQATGEL